MARRLIALTTLALCAWCVAPSMAAVNEVRLILQWTAPGDDGWVGRASKYDVRVSRTPITEGNFYWAGKVAGFITPSYPGGTETMEVTGLSPGVEYYFAVKTRDEHGNWSPISNVVRWVDATLSIQSQLAPLEFGTPYPNPARSQTRFGMTLPMDDVVRVDVYDLSGRHVRSLAQGTFEAGQRDLVWDLSDDRGRRVPFGMYLVRAQIGSTVFSRRVSVAR